MGLLRTFIEHPLTYDLVQTLAGAKAVRQRISPLLAETGGKTVLDVGAGTGGLRTWLPENARYVWLDSDPAKLTGFRASGSQAAAVLADGASLCFRDKSVDYTLCVAVLHHLATDQALNLLREMARVTRGKLLLLDPVHCPSRLASRALWSIDRGEHPRTSERIQEIVGDSFSLDRCEVFEVFHRYVVCAATPRPAC